MKLIFMNECVRQKKPERPVIVFQEDGAQREANEFELWFCGQRIGRVVYDAKLLQACDTHEVKAWVELDDDVEVVDHQPRRGEANAKRPNEPVKIQHG